MIEGKVRCQSCGMPLGTFTHKDGQSVSNFGTDAQGNAVSEWCNICFKDGHFTSPNLTCEEMVNISTRHMTKTLKMSEEQAEVLARAVIPQLRRWRK